MKKTGFIFFFVLLLTNEVAHGAFTSNVFEPWPDKDERVTCLENYIPVDSPATIIWYNRIACRACMDEMNFYYKNHSKEIKRKIIVAVYNNGFSSLEKREIKNCMRNDLFPDVNYQLIFMDECSAIMDFLTDHTPSVSVLSADGKLTFYSYKEIFTDGTVGMHTIFGCE